MKKIIVALLTVISASAFAQTDLQITGCSFNLKSSFKKEKFSSTMGWIQGFDPEGRQGWGFPMKKISSGEAFVGEVDLAQLGMKFEVKAVLENNQFTVRAVIKDVSNGETYIAYGENSRLAAGSHSVVNRLEIENPVITKIKKTLEAHQDPVDSKLFPQNVVVYEGATVECQVQ